MSTQDSVLPASIRTKRFLMLESLLGRLDGLATHTLVMLVDIAPISSLIWLADMFSLFGDGWDFAVNELEQKALIKEAIDIHRHKGTVWAIKRTLKLLGYGDCEIIERPNYQTHDRSIKHDGTKRYGSRGAWTHYAIKMKSVITKAQADEIRAMLIDIAPRRSKLVFISAPILHNRAIKHDGTYNYTGEMPL